MANDDFKVKISAELDKSAGKQIQDGINKITPKPIEVPFKINFKNSKEIEKEMNRIVSKLTNGKGSLASYKINTNTVFDKDLGKRVEKLSSATIKYKNELGEVVSELYRFNQIGSKIDDSGQEEAIMGWSKAMSNYGQNIEQVIKKEENLTKKQQASIMKQKELVEQMKLLQIQADKSGITLDQENIKGFDTANVNNNIAEMTHYLKLAKTEYSTLNAMMEKDLPISGLENMKNNIGNMPISIRNVETSFKKLLVQPDELRVRINQLSDSYQKLEAFKGSEAEKVQQYNKLKTEISGVTKEVNSLVKAQQQEVLSIDKNKFLANTIDWSRQNTKGAKLFGDEIKRIQSELKNADKTKFTNLQKEFQTIKAQTNALGQSGRGFLYKFKSDIGNFLTFVTAGGAVMSVIHTFKDIVTEVKNIDTAMISLKKVTDETNDTYNKFLTNTTQKAKELGSSISDLISATADFARLGYNLPDASKLAEVATLYKNVGDGIDISGASSSIISTMKAFNIEAKDSMSIIDKFNEVGNNFAISSAGIGDSLKNSASALMEANNTLDESIALTVAANNVVQDPEKVGNMWKTVAMRIRGAKTELEDAGLETEGMVDSTSKLRETIKSLTGGFDIMIDDNTFKSTYDIILGISKVYDKMTDTSQANLLEILAGKRQSNALAAALNNTKDLQAALESSEQSAGSALKEQEAYSKGIQYSLDSLKASFQEMASTTLDSSTIKFFVDMTAGILNATTAMGGMVPVVGALSGAFLVHKILLPLLTKQMSALLFAETGVTATTMRQIVAQTGLNGAYSLGLASISAYGAALKSFLLTNPVGWALLATTAVIGMVKAYDAATTSLKEQREITEKLQAEYQELETKLNSLNTELETTGKRIDELNGKDALTIVEQDELSNLKETNAELEIQIGLLKEQALLKSQEVAKSVAEEYAKDMQNDSNEKTYWTGRDNSYGYKEFITTNEEDYIKNMISLMQTYNSRKERGIELTKEESDYYDKIRKELVSYGIKLYDYADRYKIDDEVSQSWRDFGELIDRTLNPDKYKQEIFENIYNSDGFKKAKTELESLAKSGELSPETLSSNKEYQRLIIGTGYSAEQVVEHINAITQATTEASDSVSDFPTSTFETLNKSLDDLDKKSQDTVSSLGDLNQILHDQAQGEKLTAEQAYKLISQYPQLSSAIDKTTDGYTINAEAIETLRQSLIEQEKFNAQAQINMTTDTLNAVRDRLEIYGIELEAINDIKTALSEQNKLSLNRLFGSMDNWSFDDVTKRVTTPTGSFIANATAKEYDAIKKAYEEQKLIYDAVGKIGQLKERTNGLQNDLLSGKDFGVTDGSGKGKKTDKVKEAFELGTTDKKGNKITGKNDLDNQLAMDKITLEEYYDALELINKATYGKHKDTHLENYRQYVEEVYKGRKDLDEKARDKAEKEQKDQIKSTFDTLDYEHEMGLKTDNEYWTTRLEYAEKYYKKNGKIIDEYLDEYRDIQSGYYKWLQEQSKNSIDSQFSDLEHKYAMGLITEKDYYTIRYDLAKQYYQNNEDLQDEWQSEQEVYYKWTVDKAEEAAEKQEKIAKNLKDKYTDLIDDIADEVEKEKDNIIDALEETHKIAIDNLEKEKDAYEDIIKTQIDLLDAKKKQNDYEKNIAKQTNEISKLESRKAELQKAANSGDRTAIAELAKINEELAKKKENLSDDQADHEYDLQKEGLNKALDLNNKLMSAKIDAEKTRFEEQKSNIEKLYNQEIELIKKAAQYTKDEFGKVLDEFATRLATEGVVQSPTSLSNIKQAQSGIADTESNVSTSTRSAVLAILRNGKGKDYGEEASALAAYTRDNYGAPISKAQAVEVAKLLGVEGINKVSDLTNNDINKNKILDALRKAGFRDGGYIDASMIKRTGEDGIALVRHGEAILTNEQSKLFKELINNIKPLNNLVKLSVPKVSNITNNNSSPTTINVTVPVTGSIDSRTATTFGNTVAQQVAKAIIDIKRAK